MHFKTSIAYSKCKCNACSEHFALSKAPRDKASARFYDVARVRWIARRSVKAYNGIAMHRIIASTRLFRQLKRELPIKII